MAAEHTLHGLGAIGIVQTRHDGGLGLGLLDLEGWWKSDYAKDWQKAAPWVDFEKM